MLQPASYGRESDGRPSYPYITGWLQGSVRNAILQLQHPTTFSVEEVIDDLQNAFDQSEAWTQPYDSPTKEEE